MSTPGTPPVEPAEPATPATPAESAESATADGQPASADQTSAAPPRKSAYSMGSTPNMLRSLLVILGLVAVLIAVVPRISHVDQPGVDAGSVVSNAVRETGLPLEAPVGLPEGWKATNARFEKSTDDLMTWQGGWSTPKDGYVAIRQTKAASPNWIRTATNGGVPQGTVEAAGRTWQKVFDASHDQTSLVNEPARTGAANAVTTVVTATAGLDEILVFTNALQRAQPQ